MPAAKEPTLRRLGRCAVCGGSDCTHRNAWEFIHGRRPGGGKGIRIIVHDGLCLERWDARLSPVLLALLDQLRKEREDPGV